MMIATEISSAHELADFDLDDIAAAKLAVDGEIEERKPRRSRRGCGVKIAFRRQPFGEEDVVMV